MPWHLSPFSMYAADTKLFMFDAEHVSAYHTKVGKAIIVIRHTITMAALA